AHGRRLLGNMLLELLPRKMVSTFSLLGVPADKPCHQISHAERRRTVTLMKGLQLTVTGSRPIAEAIVTAGGVDTREIDPRTLESRRIRGLFFCGEVIDVDGDTGGYNLQAAFSTGFVAGESAACAASSSHSFDGDCPLG
ncbi:MAG: aminoacetone oxidase family FAD-binding enzyme, partial [Chloroflexi bacterium]|nr:aminoacetone oxidase family FAD-binding enzyme [Chloroflexota bacterium]